MADTLLPCPFCGSSVHLGCDDRSPRSSGKYYIECYETDCIGEYEGDDCDRLVKSWNRRAPITQEGREDG